MKIALYTCSALPKLGGQELVVDALARQYHGMGHEVRVIAPMPRRPLRPRDEELPYPVIRHPRFYSTRRGVGLYRWFLLRAQRRYGFEVIHCHDVYPTGYLAALQKQKLGVPLVITSHGGDVKEGNSRLRKAGMEQRFVRAIRAADALVSIGRFTEDGFRRLCPGAGPIVAIPNGVDLEPFARPVERPASVAGEVEPLKYLLFLGRLKDRKGVDVLLESLALRPARGGVELVIAGDGEERANLEAQAARLGLGQRARFVGRTTGDAKLWLLQNARAVVMPSRVWEAFPLVVLEAYAAGKAVVGSNIPGLCDLVREGQTGLLVPEGQAGPLAEAMGAMADRPEWAAELGERARAVAQEYGWPTVARRHLELYASLIAQAARPLA